MIRNQFILKKLSIGNAVSNACVYDMASIETMVAF